MSKTDRIQIPAMQHPSFRTSLAVQNNVEKKLMLVTWGGLGDQICAEPTLRFALKAFKDCEVSLASEQPQLFRHLTFKRVFDLKDKDVVPNYDNYLRFDTITPPDESNMVWLFFSHMLTNCVDFPSMCAFRLQLPIEDRIVELHPQTPHILRDLNPRSVFIHAGKHWQSKTFPKEFWDGVIQELVSQDAVPVLIGADTDDNRGTVDVDASLCLDLRNKLSINDSIYYLKQARVLLTNDSSPLHMAVTGQAHIGFVATCKHPDYIMHWRRDEAGNPAWAWRMKNFGKGGIWDIVDYCPNKAQKVEAENVGEHLVKWLPDPKEFASWAVSKL